MTLYDISRPISPQTAVWTDVERMETHLMLSIDQGDSVNLTRLAFTPHTGTHADAGWHTSSTGMKAHELPLEKYIGTATLVTLPKQHGAILPADIPPQNRPIQRLLIHTWMSETPYDEFRADFPYPSVELIDWLADQGAVLLGLDSPSVDAYESKTLDGHHRLRERGLVHLENLVLAGVPDGDYELIALPLKLVDVCGSPVRAVLRV